MSLEIATVTANSIADQIAFAERLAASSLLPKAYQRQPANVLLAMQYGDALGIPAIQAINGIHVIEGKPTASADLIAALVRRAGHRLRVRETGAGPTLSVTATLIRADDPDWEFVATWDMGKALEAGLTGKSVWKQYPGQMLRSRAVTEVCRQGAGDALYGVVYTPEELERDDRHTVEQVAPPASPATPPAAATEPEPAGITPAQTADLAALMKANGLDKAAMLAFARDLTGRGIKSAVDLTEDEAALVIAGLAADEQPADEQIDEATGEVVDAELVDVWQPGESA